MVVLLTMEWVVAMEWGEWMEKGSFGDLRGCGLILAIEWLLRKVLLERMLDMSSSRDPIERMVDMSSSM